MKNSTLSSKIFLVLLFCGMLPAQPSRAQTPILYGMTQNGGADSLGAIISYNILTGTESVVWSFGRDSDGQGPTGSFVYCPLNGLLYGLTTGGGVFGYGAVISFDPATNAESVLWSFGHSATGAAYPYGDLVYDGSTQLFYGMTFGGGANNTGTVFSFNPVTDSLKGIWHFGYAPGASLPYGNLVLDPNNGLYYGLTTEGGTTNDGTILTLNSQTDTVGRVFNFNDGLGGETPNAAMVWYPATNLFYGVTTMGGTDSMGVLFSFDPVDSVETTLYNFGNGTDAAQPQCNLVFDPDRNLFYGLSIDGGTNGQGTVFSFDPSGNNVSVLYNFGSGANDGQFPNGSLVYDPSDQLFYGLTQNGGAHQFGTVFSFNPANNAENTLWSLGSGPDGSEPQGSLLLLNSGHPAGISRVDNSYRLNVYPNPGNGNFVLQSQNAIGAQFNIYDTDGEVISQGTILSDHQNIAMQDASSGVYLIRINGQESTASLRFAVVK